MARYIKDFYVNSDFQSIYSIIHQYLQNEGYEYIQYDGENVFKKGNGVFANPSFFKFSYVGNTVRMETWMKYALFPGVYVGELGLDGFVGSAMKGPWKNRISKIEAILINLGNQITFQQQQYQDDNETQLLNENDSFEETCVMSDNKAEISSTIYCTGCGSQMPAGTAFCSVCGQKRQDTNIQNTLQRNSTQNSMPNQQVFSQANTFNGPNGIQASPTECSVSRKEFINKYAQPSIKRDIKSIAILCYVCAGLTFIVSCLLNPIGIIDALILTGFALGMHLAQSKVCAILILILSIIEVLLSLVSGSFPFWWLIAGISAVVTFNKIEKQYKSFIANGNRY